jgi:branched-chain amino acid transport system permease protein
MTGSFGPQLVNGLIQGCLYGMVAVGYSVVYGVLRILNLALGDVYMVGAFAGLGSLAWLFANAPAGVPGPLLFAIALLVALAVAGVLGMIVERVAFRPLLASSRTSLLIAGVAAGMVLQNSTLAVVGADSYFWHRYPVLPQGRVEVLGVRLGIGDLLIVLAAVMLALGLEYYVRRTSMGKAMRATAQDYEAAEYMGIDTRMVIRTAFFIGAAAAGVAGVLIGQRIGGLNYFSGFAIGFLGFTAAVIGGIGNLRGAMLGGLVLGAVEAVWITVIGPAYSLAAAFATLVAVLLLRPEGLLPARIIDRR